jgi:hypothetical protein
MACPGCCTGGASKKSPLHRDEASIREPETATRPVASNRTRCNNAKDVLSVGYRRSFGPVSMAPTRPAKRTGAWNRNGKAGTKISSRPVGHSANSNYAGLAGVFFKER